MADAMEKGMPAAEAEGENPAQLAQESGDYLAKVAALVEQMGSPSMKEKMAMVMKGYTSIIEEAMGGMQGAQPADQGQVPMQQGAKGVPMGPETQN